MTQAGVDAITDMVSIHSPHTRGDGDAAGADARHFGVSIHSPHTRGDQRYLGVPDWDISFQSTPLTRGETSSGNVSVINERGFNPLPSHEGRRKPFFFIL